MGHHPLLPGLRHTLFCKWQIVYAWLFKWNGGCMMQQDTMLLCKHMVLSNPPAGTKEWWRWGGGGWDLRYDVAAFTLLTLHSRVKHLPWAIIRSCQDCGTHFFASGKLFMPDCSNETVAAWCSKTQCCSANIWSYQIPYPLSLVYWWKSCLATEKHMALGYGCALLVYQMPWLSLPVKLTWRCPEKAHRLLDDWQVWNARWIAGKSQHSTPVDFRQGMP